MGIQQISDTFGQKSTAKTYATTTAPPHLRWENIIETRVVAVKTDLCKKP